VNETGRVMLGRIDVGRPDGNPMVNTRHTKSTMVVQDGQTLVIGGMMRENVSEVVTKVPFLGDLPIIGTLFRTTKVVKTKTELVILVRPTIVRTSPEAAAITKKETLELSGLEPLLPKAGVIYP